ncbi:hypothetical protein COOONC_18572 [Cooperia oncophora]
MNLLKNEKKYGGEEPPDNVPVNVCYAIIYGGSIIVPNERSFQAIIYTHGYYGCYLNERIDRINHRLLLEKADESDNIVKRLNDPEGVWRDRKPTHERLYLSPEETIFLSIDMNVLVVSENKKELTPGKVY